MIPREDKIKIWAGRSTENLIFSLNQKNKVKEKGKNNNNNL